MAVFTEPTRAYEFLLSEANGQLSRDLVTIVAGSGVLEAGTVLGKITASGKYKPYDDDNLDGSEVAAGILAGSVDATSADVQATMIARLAEVKASALVFAATNDQLDKEAGLVDLAQKFIIAR